MKACFKCNRCLPLSEFYKHKAMSDGHLGKCKDCTKNDVREHYRKNRKRILEYDRKRNRLPHRLEKVKRWMKRNPEKVRAQRILHSAVDSGRVVRCPCVVCGEIRVDAHHSDYSKPLEVVWLCRSHHRQIHEDSKKAMEIYRQTHQ